MQIFTAEGFSSKEDDKIGVCQGNHKSVFSICRQWFVNFPEYKNRDFFITGESYTGHYVPQLAKLIVESGLNFSLKGIAIGNPLLEYNTDLNSEVTITGLTPSYQMLLMNLSVQKLERILIFVYKEDLCLLEQERLVDGQSIWTDPNIYKYQRRISHGTLFITKRSLALFKAFLAGIPLA
ncbi:hypothetical protein GH714_035344 [Hevea brasiliensis]|uniref:Carboxypeptidase n=1 Tax=Hevea brasiliensis TaxID=3981 RepID=A0A6A6M6D8_HEVBR|nr:hypothetical protein GH714_035344 [Hevea brasiliensis]